MASATDIQRWDDIFHTLAAMPRRQLIDSLLHASADRELDLPEAANAPDQRADPTELTIELVHTHLPRLARCGYVEWDTEPFRAWRGPDFEDVAVVMRALQSHHEYPERLRRGCHRLGLSS